MSLEDVARELAAYRPGNQAEVIAIEAYMARRARLWAQLDALLEVRKPALARPVAG
jgi:hypothetical protein